MIKDSYSKIYYEKNKNIKSKSITCSVCGGKYSYYSKARHKKSKHHMFILNILNKKNLD